MPALATLMQRIGSSSQSNSAKKKRERERESQKDVFTKEKGTEICGPVVDSKLELSPECSEPR